MKHRLSDSTDTRVVPPKVPRTGHSTNKCAFEMLKEATETEDFRQMLWQCIHDDAVALDMIQEILGPAIYTAICAYAEGKVPDYKLEDSRADFYTYLFERRRLIRRLKKFRWECPFVSYLFLVLFKQNKGKGPRGMFWEWLRKKQRKTDCLDWCDDTKANDEALWVDSSSMTDTNSFHPDPDTQEPLAYTCLVSLKPLEKAICIARALRTYEPTLPDLQLLAEVSGRTLEDTWKAVMQVQDGCAKKDLKLSRYYQRLRYVAWRIESGEEKRWQFQHNIQDVQENVIPLLSEMKIVTSRDKESFKQEYTSRTFTKRDEHVAALTEQSQKLIQDYARLHGIETKISETVKTPSGRDQSYLLQKKPGTIASIAKRIKDKLLSDKGSTNQADGPSVFIVPLQAQVESPFPRFDDAISLVDPLVSNSLTSSVVLPVA